MLEIKNLNVIRQGKLILKNIDFSLGENQWLIIAGPNGAGKTTLVQAISQEIESQGDVLFEGNNLLRTPPRELAKIFSVLTQRHDAGYSFSVEEVVRVGRYAWHERFSNTADGDDEAVLSALEATGMEKLRNRSILTLSGGELQRTFLAQVFAQNARILLLDEAANHLDIPYQRQIFDLITQWSKQPGKAVLSVVHDLIQARSYGTHALLLNQGSCVAAGEIETVFSEENLKETYQMNVYEWIREKVNIWKG